MKSSAARDHWRHVCSNNHPFRISTVNLDSIRGIGKPGTVVNQGSFLAICGHNGSGKTTLLRCIQACLDQRAGQTPSLELQQLDDGKVTLEVYSMGEHHQIELNIPRFNRDGPSFKDIYYLEPSADTPELIKKLRTTTDLEEIIETAEPRDLETELFSYAVGKVYDRVTAYEIEIGDGMIPYFVVEANGSTYRSESMGMGEFSIFYLLWFLDFVPNNSLILIEEPEAFISPRAQAAVANVIARHTDKKRLFTVMTTHSPLILYQVPPSCVRVLARNGDTCNLLEVTDESEHLAVLGVQNPKMCIALVEDIAAQYALDAALRKFAPGVLKSLSIVRAGSWNEILKTLDGIPTDGHPMDFLSVLDADQKSKGLKSNWPILFMPGESPPDYQMLEAVRQNSKLFAESLTTTEAYANLHIGNLEGVNPHDWPHEFVKATKIDLPTVFRSMAVCWLVDGRWEKEAGELSRAIKEIVAN